MFRSIIFAAIGLCVFALTPVRAFECPAPAAFDSPATADAVAKILPASIDLDAPDAAEIAVRDLSQAGVADDVIFDNLIATKCATVAAEPDVSDADKTQRVQDFTAWVEPLVYSDAD